MCVQIGTVAAACGVFAALVAVQAISRAKHPVRRALGGMLLGVAVLAAVNLASSFTGVRVPLSPLAIGVSAAAGVPGVTLLLFLNLLLA